MKMNLRNIPAYCISLPRCEQRRDLVSKQFSSVGLDVQFFDGIDKLRKGFIVPEFSVKLQNHEYELAAGIYACMLSHINLLLFAQAKKMDAVLIFEDDVVFCDDFNERVSYIESIPDLDFDMFCLGGHFTSSEPGSMEGGAEATKWKHIYKVIAMGGTYGYVITKKVIDFVLRNITYNYGIDQFYGDYVYRIFDSYAMSPFPVGTLPGLSEITGKKWEYENVRWFYQQTPMNLK